MFSIAMIVQIPDVLAAAALAEITQRLAEAEFVDGKLTAGWHAKQVKHNQQLVRGNASQALEHKVLMALTRNQLFLSVARPRDVHTLLFSRYRQGMSYGRHTDNALMGRPPMRSDLSFTLFLSPPEAYGGGELVVEGADRETAYKLPAGTMILYPSTTLHRVKEVTHGERLVAVGWVQSLIRSAEQREILFDLDTVKRSLFAQGGKTAEVDLVAKTIANLTRMWADA